MSLRIQALTVDCRDPKALASFWADVLDWTVTFDEGDEVAIESPKGSPQHELCPDLLFIRVPEAKTVKNRLHLDLRPDDQDAEVERVIARGATRADVGQDGSESWVVLADPEGNEFCILRRLTEEEQAS